MTQYPTPDSVMANATPAPQQPDPCAEAKKAVQRATRAQQRAKAGGYFGDVRAATRRLNAAIKKYNGLGCSTKKGN